MKAKVIEPEMIEGRWLLESLSDQEIIDDLPHYAIWRDRLLRRNPPLRPEHFGYRFLQRRPEFGGGAAEHARPFALWLLLKTRLVLREGFYEGLHFLWKKGLIHHKYEAMKFRWRDLRLGPDRVPK